MHFADYTITKTFLLLKGIIYYKFEIYTGTVFYFIQKDWVTMLLLVGLKSYLLFPRYSNIIFSY